MYKTIPVLNLNGLYDIRELSRQQPSRVRRFMTSDLRPAIREIVAYRLKPYPPARKGRFVFATPKSKRYYIWMARKGMVPTAGGHYIRSNTLSNHWQVSLDRRRTDENVLQIYNDAYSTVSRPAGFYSQYVLPSPKQVRGHVVTGWGANYNAHIDEIVRVSNTKIASFWLSQYDKGR
jgi:hypothetical protein